MNSEISYAYLSALIDGEGCVTIGWQTNRGYLHPRPIIKISFKQIDETEKLINLLKTNFRGTTNIYNKKATWQLTAYDDLEEVIINILPHSIIKEEQIKLLLKSINTLRETQKLMYLPHSKDTIIKLAKISGSIDKLKYKIPRKKWTSENIIEYVTSSEKYTEEHRANILKLIKEEQKKSGARLKLNSWKLELPEIKEKKLKAIRISARRRAQLKYPDELVIKAHDLYQNGETVKNISEILNVSYYSIWDWVKRGVRSSAFTEISS